MTTSTKVTDLYKPPHKIITFELCQEGTSQSGTILLVTEQSSSAERAPQSQEPFRWLPNSRALPRGHLIVGTIVMVTE